MISIDLANDVEIAKELQDYLKSKGIDSHLEAAEIKIDKTAFDLKIFKSFQLVCQYLSKCLYFPE